MKNKVQKIAIFGGSFDPLHYGHVDIVKNLERLFDSVIVVPSYISPFKSGAEDGAIRFKLCKKVFTSQKTEVSRFEIGKKTVSYSVVTAEHFAKKNKDAKLFWVIGSEEVERLTDWHDIDKLKTLVTFYVVPRPNYVVKDEVVKSLKKRKIKIKLAGFDGLDISSARIKIDIAFGKTNKYVPDTVYKYALKNGLFDSYKHYVDGLYKHGLSESRIEHSYRTAVRGAELAKLYGASVNDAVIACILHDIGKAENVEKYSGTVDISDYPLPTAHSPIGAYIAKKEYGVSDEIAHAIEVHSTGDENMSVLDEIVYLADKTEEGRKYASLGRMRYLSEQDRTLAMYAALKEIKELRETTDCIYGERALEYYENLCAGKPMPDYPPKTESAEKKSTLPMLGEVKSKSVRLVPDAPSKSLREVPQNAKAVRDATHYAASTFDPESWKKRFVSTGNAIKDIAVAAADALNSHKAHEINIVDLDGKTIVADYFVIASVTSSTAVKALTGYVEDRLTKQFGIDPNKRDMDKEWVALDYGGVIIHIFTDKTREFYNIERLWSDGSNIERYGD